MHDKDIVYYINRKQTQKAVIFFATLGAASFLCFVYRSSLARSSNVSETFLAVLGISGFILFVTFAALFLRRLCFDELYLIINPNGIYDNGSRMWSGAGWIAWADISDIQVSTYNGHPSVELIPKDCSKSIRYYRWFARINRFRTSPVVLRPPLIPVAARELADQLKAYWQAA